MATDNETVNETVEDIVAMLRRFAKGEELPTDEIPSFTSLADCVEAAWKRERKELYECIRQMLTRWCNMACTCEHCEFNVEPCARWRKILEGGEK